MSDVFPETGSELRGPASPAAAAAAPPPATGARELFLRHARRDGRSVAILRAVDYGDSCVVEADVYRPNAAEVSHPGPYTFANPQQATAFVTEAVEALMYLGCDIQAQ